MVATVGQVRPRSLGARQHWPSPDGRWNLAIFPHVEDPQEVDIGSGDLVADFVLLDQHSTHLAILEPRHDLPQARLRGYTPDRATTARTERAAATGSPVRGTRISAAGRVCEPRPAQGHDLSRRASRAASIASPGRVRPPSPPLHRGPRCDRCPLPERRPRFAATFLGQAHVRLDRFLDQPPARPIERSASPSSLSAKSLGRCAVTTRVPIVFITSNQID